MSWLLILLPLVGVVAIILSPARMAKTVSLLTTLVVFGVSIGAAVGFDGWGKGTWGLLGSFDWLSQKQGPCF